MRECRRRDARLMKTEITSNVRNHLLRLAAVFVAAISAASCSQGSGNATTLTKTPAQTSAVEVLTRRPVTDIPQIKRAVDSAIAQTQQTFSYDPSYAKLEYPT